MMRPLSWVLAISSLAAGCGKRADDKAAPAAKVEHAVPESRLATITLSPEAVSRLGIETATVDTGGVAPTRVVGGEVITPPGRALTIAAPAAGTVLVPEEGGLPAPGRRVAKGEPLLRLLALPPDQAKIREVAEVARARLRQAEAEAKRVSDLYAERLVSTRDQERAQADLAAARAANDAAQAQLAQVEQGSTAAASKGLAPLRIVAPQGGVVLRLHVAAGQAVAAGTSLLELVGVDRLWVRVPLYVGDARSLARGRAVAVMPLGSEPGRAVATATPVVGPPVADPAAASADLYFEIKGGAVSFRPGERVSVALPLSGPSEAGRTVPTSAIVIDANGGAWVYERLDSLSFARRRVEVTRVVGDRAVIARGPVAGTQVVIAGAAELFGTEFGAGK